MKKMILFFSIFFMLISSLVTASPTIAPPPVSHEISNNMECVDFLKKEMKERENIADIYYNYLKDGNYEKAFNMFVDISEEEREAFNESIYVKTQGKPIINYALIESSVIFDDEGSLLLILVYSVQYNEIFITVESLAFDLNRKIGIHGIAVKVRRDLPY